MSQFLLFSASVTFSCILLSGDSAASSGLVRESATLRSPVLPLLLIEELVARIFPLISRGRSTSSVVFQTFLLQICCQFFPFTGRFIIQDPAVPYVWDHGSCSVWILHSHALVQYSSIRCDPFSAYLGLFCLSG